MRLKGGEFSPANVTPHPDGYAGCGSRQDTHLSIENR